jgi:hypothetical protein
MQITITNTIKDWDSIYSYPFHFHLQLKKNSAIMVFKHRIEKAYFYNLEALEKKLFILSRKKTVRAKCSFSYFDALCLLYVLQHYPIQQNNVYLQNLINENILQIDSQL